MKKFFSKLGSYIIALLRLVLLNINFFFSGLHTILFSNIEITNIEMKGTPLRCDKENTSETMAYLDKLCLENPDLLDFPDTADGINGDSPLYEFDDPDDNGKDDKF